MARTTAALDALVADVTSLPPADRLQLLVELGDELPESGRDHATMERVVECRSPLYLDVAVDAAGAVRLTLDAPAEAPTTRGFAALLHQALDGASPEEVLATPDDLPLRLGLTGVVSPLRLNGMAALLARIKSRLREATPPGRATAP